MLTSMHVTVDGLNFCDGPRMCIHKVKKLCINNNWIALLIHEFVPVKTWLLIACGTALYAIMHVGNSSAYISQTVRNSGGWFKAILALVPEKLHVKHYFLVLFLCMFSCIYCSDKRYLFISRLWYLPYRQQDVYGRCSKISNTRQKGLEKQHNPRSESSLFAILTSILWIPALLTHILFENRKRKVWNCRTFAEALLHVKI